MDIELARTLLKVIKAGNFVSAADDLHITQAAVSRRIKAAEGYSGVSCSCAIKPARCSPRLAGGFRSTLSSSVRALGQARHEIGVQALGHCALCLGFTVLFTTPTKVLNQLHAARA
jgi:LysR family transcriptional regulator, flagellar master operon regulator